MNAWILMLQGAGKVRQGRWLVVAPDKQQVPPLSRSLRLRSRSGSGRNDKALWPRKIKLKGSGQERQLHISLFSADPVRVVNPQDFDALSLYAIHSDVGQWREQKLSGIFLASGTAKMRPVC